MEAIERPWEKNARYLPFLARVRLGHVQEGEVVQRLAE